MRISCLRYPETNNYLIFRAGVKKTLFCRILHDLNISADFATSHE